jgi:hypothetical protein
VEIGWQTGLGKGSIKRLQWKHASAAGQHLITCSHGHDNVNSVQWTVATLLIEPLLGLRSLILIPP